MTTSTRGRCSGSEPRPACRCSARARFSAGSAFSCSASARGDRLFEILQRQVELVGIELLRAPAELHALQLAEQVAQPVVLAGEPVALPRQPRLFGTLGIALGPRRQHQGAQRRDILGKGLGVVTAALSHRANICASPQPQAESNCRSLSPRPSAGRSAAHTPAANRAPRTGPPAAPRTAASPRR